MFPSRSSEKKLVKPLKYCFFWTQFAQKRSLWATPKMEKLFFAEITKADHQLSESFYFIKIYVLTELWIFFYLEWCFLSKKVISSENSCGLLILHSLNVLLVVTVFFLTFVIFPFFFFFLLIVDTFFAHFCLFLQPKYSNWEAKILYLPWCCDVSYSGYTSFLQFVSSIEN